MSTLQKFGQAIAIAILSAGPILAALWWAGHVIQDSDSVAGTLAVNSVVALVAAFLIVGALVTGMVFALFWVWIFGIAWESDEARGRAPNVG